MISPSFKSGPNSSIAIIEIYSHHVFVHTLAASLLESGYKVTIYVTERIARDLLPLFAENRIGPKFVVAKNNENEFLFLRRIRREIELKNDLLFINSIQGYRIGYFYFNNFNIPKIAAAGRISEFFGSEYRLRGFDSIRQFLHHNYTKFFLPKVIRRLDAIIVHTEQAKTFALDNQFTKPIHCMPFSLYLGQSPKSADTGSLEMLVTGQIVEGHRDYFGLLSIFESIWMRGFINIKLTVLTSPVTEYGYAVAREMERLGKKGFPITYFNDWIPELEFLKTTAKAQFIIAPILPKGYGKGELTSVHVESVRMGIPAIYPSWYRPDPTVESSSIYYDSFHMLENQIIDLYHNPGQVCEISNKAVKNVHAYCLEPVAIGLSDFLKDFIHTDV